MNEISKYAGNELMEAALTYARMCIRVFPLHSPRDQGCSCGKSKCTSIAKHPRTLHGLKDATTDEAVIHGWWKQVRFCTHYICAPMKPDARHLKRTAIHEAGHAVMHYLERVPFESVTIRADSATGSDGAVHPRLGPLWLWDRQRPKTLRILMAGKVAEEFHTGRPVTRATRWPLPPSGPQWKR